MIAKQALSGCALFLSVGFTADVACAQIANSRLNRLATADDAARIGKRWAECTADLEPKFVRALLATLPGSADENNVKNGHSFDNDRCLEDDKLQLGGDRALKVHSTKFRGRVAEYLALKALRKEPNYKPLPGAASASLNQKLTRSAAKGPIDRTLAVGAFLAACVVDEAWQDSVAYISSEPGSAAEKAQLTSISPMLGPCFQDGAKIVLDRAIIRLLLAEAVYSAITYVPEKAAS